MRQQIIIMALPKIEIKIGNGGLGIVEPTADGLAGMIVQGAATADLPLLVPKLLTSLADAVDLGLDADYDTDNSVDVYLSIKEFYDGAGTGAELWIMLVSQAVDMQTIFDVSETDYAVKLLNAAGGGIRMLTMVRNPAAGYSPTITGGMDADVGAAITRAQGLALAYVAQYKPLRVIIPAYGYNGIASDAADLRQRTDNRVAVLLGGSTAGFVSIGVLLGRLASVPVQRNPGRVKNGSLPIIEAYIGAETVEAAAGDVQVLHNRGYITLRQHVGKAGYYFSDDPTATAATDDYSRLANGRVIDKAIFIAYQTFVNELLDEIRVDPNTGKLPSALAKYYQVRIESAINGAMTANNEISGVGATVDTNQNVLSTGEVAVSLRVVPVGYGKTFVIDLGLATSV